VRFHLAPDGSIRIGGGEGRGAWLCPELDCLDEAIRRRRFQRALRADIGPDSLAELAREISARGFLPGSCQDGTL
jgi:predicted RNA-binding protein YlxR (DUF448 family)